MATLTHRAWSLKRILDTVEETSHAFLLPAALRNRLGEYDPPAIEAELARIQVEIDAIAFELYGFDEADRAAVLGQAGNLEATSETAEADDEGEDDEPNTPADQQSALLSWCVGVAFGRFDIRLATGERAPPPEPEPFDPLPLRSPGMLPPETEPFHTYPGILVDDPGHPHDLTRLVEAIVERLDYPLPPELRRWLQRDFFPYHLQRYSKSRCQAPIYWPLTTLSGGYTLWLYYPRLTDQTLYTAINDFLEPKLKQVTERLTALRTLANRNRPQEKELEQLTDIELELKALRDELLRLAPVWKPNLNDGVQITAAPLWKRFRLPKWQKTLKETWQKLERGDYDWAHLAYHFWPERVREKCRHDKSLAIAHNLEALYEAPPEPANKKRGRQRRV
ncbi:MAG: type II restriction endonuclease subunit M [Candidatus Competibacteraceae bacterium]